MQNTITTNTDTSLEAKILRFEGECAVLQNEYGEFRWPIGKLPAQHNLGDIFVIAIKDPEEETNKLKTMRKLLEELIN